jgi:alpha-glucosidase (family GH31 glycosyl hydrolase)
MSTLPPEPEPAMPIESRKCSNILLIVAIAVLVLIGISFFIILGGGSSSVKIINRYEVIASDFSDRDVWKATLN